MTSQTTLVVETKKCSACQEIKPVEEFHFNSRQRDNRQNNCIMCQRGYIRSRRNKNPDAATDMDHASRQRRRIERPEEYQLARLRERVKRHHWSVEAFNETLRSQENSCAVCFTKFEGALRHIHIDHDHGCCPGPFSCGSCIRGLLCSSCNTGLGAFKDNPLHLVAAVRYLDSRTSPV